MSQKKFIAADSPAGQLKGTIITLAGAACWGFSGCCGQFLFSEKHLEVLWVVPWRMLFAGLILMLTGFVLNGKENLAVFRNKKDALYTVIFGLFGVLMSQCTYFFAVSSSNAATATVLQNLAPVLILLVVCVARRKRPTLAETAAIFLTVFGVFLIGTHGNFHQLQMTPQGLFWGLMAAVSAMLYSTMSGPIIRKYGTCQILGYAMTTGGIASSLVLQPWKTPVVLDAGVLGGMFVVIFIGSALAYGLFLSGVSVVGPLKGGLYGSMEPISAIIISVVWLGARFQMMDFVGFALVLVGAGILAVRKQS